MYYKGEERKAGIPNPAKSHIMALAKSDVPALVLLDLVPERNKTGKFDESKFSSDYKHLVEVVQGW